MLLCYAGYADRTLRVRNQAEGLSWRTGVEVSIPGRESERERERMRGEIVRCAPDGHEFVTCVLDCISRIIGAILCSRLCRFATSHILLSEQDTMRSIGAASSGASSGIPDRFHRRELFRNLLPFLSPPLFLSLSFSTNNAPLYVLFRHFSIIMHRWLFLGLFRGPIDRNERF